MFSNKLSTNSVSTFDTIHFFNPAFILLLVSLYDRGNLEAGLLFDDIFSFSRLDNNVNLLPVGIE